MCSLRLAVSCVRGDAAALAHWPLNAVSLQSGHNDAVAFRRQWRELLYNLSGSFFCEDEGTGGFQDELPNPASRQGRGVSPSVGRRSESTQRRSWTAVTASVPLHGSQELSRSRFAPGRLTHMAGTTQRPPTSERPGIWTDMGEGRSCKELNPRPVNPIVAPGRRRTGGR